METSVYNCNVFSKVYWPATITSHVTQLKNYFFFQYFSHMFVSFEGPPPPSTQPRLILYWIILAIKLVQAIAWGNVYTKFEKNWLKLCSFKRKKYMMFWKFTENVFLLTRIGVYFSICIAQFYYGNPTIKQNSLTILATVLQSVFLF